MEESDFVVADFIEDLLDETHPGKLVQGNRRHARHNRTLPALLFPWDGRRVLTDQPLLTTTKDLSTGGAALLLQQDFPWDEFLLTLPYGKAPVFILSVVQHRSPLVFGFSQIGVRWKRFVMPDECPELGPIVGLIQQLNASLEPNA